MEVMEASLKKKKIRFDLAVGVVVLLLTENKTVSEISNILLMGLETLFNLLLQDSNCCSKNLSRWFNPISRDAFKLEQSVFCSLSPKRQLHVTAKACFQLQKHYCLGYQAFYMLGSHWLLNRQIRKIGVHLQCLGNLPLVPYILPSPPVSPLKCEALFVAFCL